MKLAIEDGVANSLGLGGDLVKIVSVDGVEVRRRLVEDLDIAFEIQSPAGPTGGSMQAKELQKNLREAATSGALVTHVQAEAASAGVLVESLKNMTAALYAPAVEIGTKAITVFEQQRPGKTHVNKDKMAGDTMKQDIVIVIGGIFGGLAVLLICIFFVTRSSSAGSSEPTLIPRQEQTRV